LTRYSQYCTGFYRHRNQTDEEWISEIKKLVHQLNIDVILPVATQGVNLISQNREVISKVAAIPPIAQYETIKRFQDKWHFYCFINEQGFPSVPSVLIDEPEEIISEPSLIDSIEYPALLKPVLLKGGLGIVEVKKQSDLQQAWKDKRIRKGYKYLLQSYIPGTDLCLQVFCKDGKIVAYTLQKSLLNKNNHYGPQKIMEFIKDGEVLDLGRRLVSAMHWDGIACIDFRIDTRDGTNKILEINPRFGQAVLGSLVAGVNFPLIACLDALNMEYHNQYRTIKYAHPIAAGKNLLTRFTGRRVSVNIRWMESGLRFACSDPLPETFEVLGRSARWINKFILCRRSHSDNCGN
jgi:D-aspartate ligase